MLGRIRSVAVLLLTFVAGVGPLRAQNSAIPEGPATPTAPADAAGPTVVMPVMSVVEPDGPWSVFAPRLSAGYTTGPGFGYQYGYTTLDAFWPIFGANSNNLVFVDTRALISDDRAQWGNNVEFGYRRYNPERNRVAGIWSSWDLRNTSAATYNQLSGGLESYGRYVDGHANYYVVTGPQFTNTGTFILNAPILTPHNVLLPTVMNYESALSGTDLELGGPVPFLGRYGFRAYAGGYAYHADTYGDVGGGQMRLLARVSNNMDMNLQVRSDNAFGTTVAFTGSLRWGGVRRAYREPERDSVFNRMEDPTQRNTAVSVLNKSKGFTQFALNPATGLPIFIIYVNNTAAPGGDGSFQRPLNTLAAAPALAGVNGFIALEPGNGTTAGQNAGIMLLNGQHLLGTGVPNPIVAQQGIFTLPAIGTGTPVITNSPGANVVTLANNNEVANLAILATGGSNGIVGTGITNFNLRGLTITGDASQGPGDGILLTDATGLGTITGVTVTQMSNQGLAINQNTGALTVNVLNSAFDFNQLDGIALTTNNASSLTFSIQNSSTSNNQNSGDGINAVSNDTSTLNLAVNRLTAVGNTCCGVETLSTGSSTVNATISNSNLSNNMQQGIDALVTDSSTTHLTVTNTTIANNMGTGINLTASDTSVATLSASGNTLTGNGTGVTLISFNSATVSATFNNNISNGANLAGFGFGFEALSTGSSVMTVTVSGNTFNSNTDIGILAQAQDTSRLQFTASGNQVIGGTIGIQAERDDQSRLGFTATGNTLSNQTNTGMFLTQLGTPVFMTGDLVAVVTNNMIAGSPVQGFFANNSNTGTLSLGLHNNVSTGTALAYNLAATAGQINLERDANGAFPPFTASGGTNQGVPVSLSGTINNVPFGSVVP